METNTEPRTYGWYLLNHYHSGTREFYTEKPDHKYCNAPSPQVHIDHYTKLGLIDKVPTLETLVPLLEKYTEWRKLVDKDFSIMREEKKSQGLMETLHWTLSGIFKDPYLDGEILRQVARRFPTYTIPIIENPGCPKDVLIDVLQKSGTKEDPARDTNGGEIGCFFLYNEDLPSDVIDMVVRKTKRVKIQLRSISHKNVSRETLVFLSENGRSDTVKKKSLLTMVEKGWLDVK